MAFPTAQYPSKFISLSASVILVRPFDNPKSSFLDYQILMLKRNPNLSFGGYFAFPGGMIEKQDYVHKWESKMPLYYRSEGKHLPDFTKRMTVVRELFEETNLLLSREQSTINPKQRLMVGGNEKTELRDKYLQKYSSDFIKFC